MNEDSLLLSALPSTQAVPLPPLPRHEETLVFDACHAGVVLRTLLFVHLVVAVVLMFVARSPMDWLQQSGAVSAGTVPATLAWLLVGCQLKRWLARWSTRIQVTCGVLLGALCAQLGAAVLWLSGTLNALPWLASASGGALLSSLLVAGLLLRARARTPASTTARLAQLQANIRPHFLFNTLNSAIALVRAEPARAEQLLEDLSDLFRCALQEQSAPVTLEQEIALAKRYLDIEQVRFSDRLRLRWLLDAQADGAQLPALLLQPLVENAVRHGVEPSAEGADLEICTERRGSRVVIKVRNTLPGGPGQPGAGLALRNVRERLHLLHDLQASFQTRLVDGVFEVRIEVPA